MSMDVKPGTPPLTVVVLIGAQAVTNVGTFGWSGQLASPPSPGVYGHA
jgi:hypothetical protein